MQPKERFMKAMHREPVDRTPVAAVATGITVGLMEKCGVYWPEAHREAEKLAKLAASIWEYTDIEAIKLPFDMAVEVEALGARIDDRTIDTLPTEIGHLYNHPDELHIPDDFLDLGRISTVLQAVSTLRRRYDREAPIITSIVGPFSLAAKLFGFENFLIWLITNPEYVHQAMAALTPLAIRYANAQVEAGADVIILGEASCSGDLISPLTYRDFIMPYHQQLCASITAPNIMHICGKSSRHLPYIRQTSTSCYNFDEGVPVRAAVSELKGQVVVAGNVPTVTVLLYGTPKTVYAATTQCLDEGVDILTPGCAMAPHTPLENIAAMTDAVHDWAARQAAAL